MKTSDKQHLKFIENDVWHCPFSLLNLLSDVIIEKFRRECFPLYRWPCTCCSRGSTGWQGRSCHSSSWRWAPSHQQRSPAVTSWTLAAGAFLQQTVISRRLLTHFLLFWLQHTYTTACTRVHWHPCHQSKYKISYLMRFLVAGIPIPAFVRNMNGVYCAYWQGRL